MAAGRLPDFDVAAARERDLTPRQRDVLALLARGHTNAAIAWAQGGLAIVVTWRGLPRHDGLRLAESMRASTPQAPPAVPTAPATPVP